MQSVTVSHISGDRFAINVRGHTLEVDQPVADCGSDVAPTPTELFIAGLASCVAFYARRYLARHDLPTDGLGVETEYAFASRPARVAEIRMKLTVPPTVPTDRRNALLAVASHCTVHNTLETPPHVTISLETVEAATSALN